MKVFNLERIIHILQKHYDGFEDHIKVYLFLPNAVTIPFRMDISRVFSDDNNIYIPITESEKYNDTEIMSQFYKTINNREFYKSMKNKEVSFVQSDARYTVQGFSAERDDDDPNPITYLYLMCDKVKLQHL